MIFSSLIFIFCFLPAVLFSTWALSRYQSKHNLTLYFLLAASFFFYAYWKVAYLPILIVSILLNYALGEKIRTTKSKLWLTFGALFNLALLGYYKYADFFIENLNTIIGSDFSHLRILLPLGISFFTFQQIAYLIDTYQQKTEKTKLSEYSFFVSFFPQLIAGPIVHHRHILPFIKTVNGFKINAGQILSGLFVFSMGLFKKVLIADSIAVYATPFFNAVDSGTALNTASAMLGMLAYTFQIYFDFSGYSDMAIGLGLMVGLQLPINFNSPYKSANIIEFWRRWHITLSEFLRDYLYIPLGGNRKGKTRRYINLSLTMLLGGLWHGASWNFVLWGGLHGAFLMINHAWRTTFKDTWVTRLPRLPFIFVTFFAAALAWVPFRATTWDGTLLFYQSFFNWPASLKIWSGPVKGLNIDLGGGWELIALCALIAFALPNSWTLMEKYQAATRFKKTVYNILGLVLFIASAFALTYFANRTSEFIYFNF